MEPKKEIIMKKQKRAYHTHKLTHDKWLEFIAKLLSKLDSKDISKFSDVISYLINLVEKDIERKLPNENSTTKNQENN